MRPSFVETLAAWCVVPYDDRERTPAQRADVLASLGFDGLAWDWRDEHVSDFAEQLDALAERGLALTAIWAPVPDGSVSAALGEQIAVAADRGLTPQLWACAEFGAPDPVAPMPPDTQGRNVREFADRLEPLATLAKSAGMPLAIYNHLGWAGEPVNQI